jgi:hypothetical protein
MGQAHDQADGDRRGDAARSSVPVRRSVAIRALTAGFLTALLAFAGLVYRANTVRLTSSASDAPYAPAFRGERSGPGAMLNAHDGQAFGSLALDPLLAHPERWKGGRAELGYRAARPVLGWLVLVTSFGSKTAVEWSLLAWTAIGIGLIAAAALVLADRWQRKGDWVPLLLLLPGVVMQLLYGGLCDALAAGLALLGLAWWMDGRDRAAVVVLCVAGLTRESALLVPLALILATGWRRRTMFLAAPFLAYAGWVSVVWLRLRVWPNQARPDGLGLPPGNFRVAIRSWTVVEVVSALVLVVLFAVAWRRAPGREVRWLVALSALFALTLGPIVLRSWDFSRPLLPATVVGACLLARRTRAEDGSSQADDSLGQPGDRLVMAVARPGPAVPET